MLFRSVILAVLLCFSARMAFAEEHSVPNMRLTPGDTQPNLTEADVCKPDFGKLRVPPAELQRKIFAAYGLPEGNRTGYCETADGCAINRLIPASLGGTNDPRNLWPLSLDAHEWNVSAKKMLEEKLHELVCHGELSLADAQSAIAKDWISAYQSLIGESPSD